jgi:cytochrome c553
MKRLVKWFVRVLLVLAALVVLLLAYVYWRSAAMLAKTYDVTVPELLVPSDGPSIARGKYLVEKAAMCAECHGQDLGGRVMMDNFAMGRLAAANLTRGRGGVGARYGDRDFVRALVHGVRADGRSVIFMPSSDYQFSEADLGAIIAYIKSVPPVDRELPAPVAGPMVRTLTVFADFPLVPAARIDHDHVRFARSSNPGNPVAAGEYLVASGGCRGCHGPELTGGSGPPPGAANITPVGIGGWSEQDFLRALREHKRPNGATIDEAMPRAFGQMSDDDLHRMFEYLKAVPAKGEKTKNQMKS